jgi:hypothetical protein
MSDRSVFTAALVTAVLILAGAFVLPQLFFFESAKAIIPVAIAVLVFYGEDCYSYMLGIVFPPLWFIVDVVMGAFGHDFRVLLDFVSGNPVSQLNTPLHAVARLTAAVLSVVSVRAWRKQVPEKFLGKTFWICLVICLAYVGLLTLWYMRLFSQRGQMP